MGEITTVSPGAHTWSATLGVGLCPGPKEGRYDEEARIGSGLFLNVSSMFIGGTWAEYWGFKSEATLKAEINLWSSATPGE